ncbi:MULTISPECIES: DUF987 domain-containing protein [Enterobacter]|uniref:DUF987 domain-containing protein n=1 Tax=Enterobacter TaxID=547 RepID=UPI0003A33C4B|nr:MULTISPECIES: DUF987 domain-containing protein [Enterobacter]ASA06022.1 hypothetical protein AM432_20450 [Enterobacter cloacae complex sp.]MDV5355019.1 DUF987 domain-containing protein [Enterobacter asburiae]CAE6056278.1 hypothetical protein AH0328V1_4094 [Enterobacter cloacae]HBC2582074.1 DUF987 domain-containing protein [Enterobacter hormaechei subsp. hoffmannii]ALA00676.1 hypothetical protein LI63_005140 [Enterobacter hormaechei subsp. xiangfangensis]
MRIVSKRRAMAIYRQHPASCIFRYCTSRYQWHGSVCHYTGKVVPDIPGVLAVYAERRQDRNGPYACLMSIILN